MLADPGADQPARGREPLVEEVLQHRHDPQVEPALVQLLMQATSARPAGPRTPSTAPQMVALVTLLQLHATASSGIPTGAAPPRDARRISSSGFSGG